MAKEERHKVAKWGDVGEFYLFFDFEWLVPIYNQDFVTSRLKCDSILSFYLITGHVKNKKKSIMIENESCLGFPYFTKYNK